MMLDQGGRVGGWVRKGQDQDPHQKKRKGSHLTASIATFVQLDDLEDEGVHGLQGIVGPTTSVVHFSMAVSEGAGPGPHKKKERMPSDRNLREAWAP